MAENLNPPKPPGVRFDNVPEEESLSKSSKTSPTPSPRNGSGGLSPASNGNGKKKPLLAKPKLKLKGDSKLLSKFKVAATKVKKSNEFVEKSRANLVIDDSSSSEDSSEDELGKNMRLLETQNI